jgi:tetratricopeptide (TPR) repeat protein
LLETIRQYAHDKLREAGEVGQVLQCHRDWYVRLAQEAEPLLRSKNQLEWLDRLERDYANLRTALSWSLERPADVAITASLGAALIPFWEARGYLSEGFKWLTAILEQLKSVGSKPELNDVRAKILLGLGLFCNNDSVQETLYYGESLSLFEAAADKWGMALVLHYQVFVASGQRDFERAAQLHERSLSLFREVGDKWGIALAFQNKGFMFFRQGDYTGARLALEESLALFREVGNQADLNLITFQLAFVALNQADYKRAATLYEENMEIAKTLGNKRALGLALRQLAYTFLRQGDYVPAAESAAESVRVYRELNDRRNLPELLLGYADILIQKGDYAAALSPLHEGLALCWELNSRPDICFGLRLTARILVVKGQASHAHQLLCAVEELYPDIISNLSLTLRSDYLKLRDTINASLEEAQPAAVQSPVQALNLEETIAFALEEISSQLDEVFVA